MCHQFLHDIITIQILQWHVHIGVCHDLHIHDDIILDDIEYDDIIHDDIMLSEHVIGQHDCHHVHEMCQLMHICYREVIWDLYDILRLSYSHDIIVLKIINVHIYVILDIELSDIQVM